MKVTLWKSVNKWVTWMNVKIKHEWISDRVNRWIRGDLINVSSIALFGKRIFKRICILIFVWKYLCNGFPLPWKSFTSKSIVNWYQNYKKLLNSSIFVCPTDLPKVRASKSFEKSHLKNHISVICIEFF